MQELKPLYDELEEHEESVATIVEAWLTDLQVQTQSTRTRELSWKGGVTGRLIEDCQRQVDALNQQNQERNQKRSDSRYSK